MEENLNQQPGKSHSRKHRWVKALPGYAAAINAVETFF
jgi:hypothetical protein